MLSETAVRRLAAKAAASSLAKQEQYADFQERKEIASGRIRKARARIDARRELTRATSHIRKPREAYGDEANARNMARFKRGRETKAFLAQRAALAPENRDWATVVHFNAFEEARDHESMRREEECRRREHREALDEQNRAAQVAKDTANEKRIAEGEALRAQIRAHEKEARRLKAEQKVEFAAAIAKRLQQEREFENKRRDRHARKLAQEQKEVARIKAEIRRDCEAALARKQKLAQEQAIVSAERERQAVAREQARKRAIEAEVKANRDFEAMMAAKDAQRQKELAVMEAKQRRLVEIGLQTQASVEERQRADEERAKRERADFEAAQDAKAAAAAAAQRRRKAEILSSLQDQIRVREETWEAANKERYAQGRALVANFERLQREHQRAAAQKRQAQLRYKDDLVQQARQDFLARARELRGAGTMSATEQALNRDLLRRARQTGSAVAMPSLAPPLAISPVAPERRAC